MNDPVLVLWLALSIIGVGLFAWSFHDAMVDRVHLDMLGKNGMRRAVTIQGLRSEGLRLGAELFFLALGLLVLAGHPYAGRVLRWGLIVLQIGILSAGIADRRMRLWLMRQFEKRERLPLQQDNRQ